MIYSYKFITYETGIRSSDVATFGVGAVQVLATTLTLWLADKSGRRLLLIVSLNFFYQI